MMASNEVNAFELQALVAKLLERKHEIATGNIQILGLDGLRESLGERWPDVEQKVLRIVRLLLRRRIVPPDLAVPMGNYQWLLVFPKRPAGSAKSFVDTLIQELRRMFLGVPEAAALEVVGTAGSLADVAAAHPLPTPAEQRETPVSPAPAPVDEAEPAMPQGAGATGHGLADPTGFDLPDLPSDVIEFRFMPIWDVQTGFITSNICQAILFDTGGDLLLGIDTLEDREDYEALAVLDRNALTTAVKALHATVVAGAPIEMTVPVHYGPINVTHHRIRYLELLHQIPIRLRRWVVLQLSEVPAGAPARNLTEIASGLRPNCRDVTAVQRTGELNPAIFRQSSVSAVGVSMAELAFRSTEELKFRVEDAAMVIMQAGFTPFFVEVRRPETALFATASGAGHISGPFATGVSETPLPPKTLTLGDATGQLQSEPDTMPSDPLAGP